MKLGISLVLGLVSLVSYGQTPVGMSSSAAFAPTPPNPVTTDSWVQKAKLTASDSTGLDGFGFSVYASGNIIMVGAPDAVISQEQGAIYVFVKSASGICLRNDQGRRFETLNCHFTGGK
jgi:hypothetical protein